MRYRMIPLFALVLCFVFTTKVNASSVNTPYCQRTKDSSITAKIESISMDRSAMQIRCRQDKSFINPTITIADPALQAAVQHFGEGDQVVLEYKTENEKNILQNLSVKTQELGLWLRIGTLIGFCLLLLLVFRFFLQNGLWNLIVGIDNRYSNSKTQIVLWFFILITTYIASIVLRGLYGGIDFVGGVSIPQNLLLLSGLSALTFATAKGITQDKFPPGKEKPKADKPKFPDDLFLDDQRRVDLGDFQMIIITLLAVFVYLAEVLGFLGTIEFHKVVTLPDVDTTILATFGLGQGIYLAKKFVGDAGGGNPVTSPTPALNTTPDPNAVSPPP
ncbi:hypothetical protein [Synechocystis sp. PCC 7509]|uniref:hypothetical protein n=1 Tax=Synechocystis sp. PCC 7509 TaxID=927677 RepID=UPI0002ABBDA8|nr:hypothetical protein [Synechocystis sp. PCC 7509]